MKKRLGEILLERGLIDVRQLHDALEHQRQWGTRLGAALVARGAIAEGTLTRVLSEVLGFPMVDLARVVVEPAALALVSRRTCEDHDVLPLSLKTPPTGRRVLVLAMADPLNATVIDEIGFSTDCLVKPAIAPISSIGQAIRRYCFGVPIDVAPLDFDARPTNAPGPATGSMTVTTIAGGDPRVVEDAADPVLTLTDEVGASVPDAAALPDDYAGQRTGVFMMPPVTDLGRTSTPVIAGRPVSDVALALVQATELERLEAMERKFWALMRLLARRGVVSNEDFAAELRGDVDG
jgi:hypothetical protein